MFPLARFICNRLSRSCNFAAFVLILAMFLSASAVTAQTLLVDTGAASNTTIGGAALFSTGGACSPEPVCQTNFQFLAARFTLAQATTLDSVGAWMGSGTGGNVTVRIRSVNVAKNGLPGETTPPYLGATSIYQQTYPVPGSGLAPNWVLFPGFNPVLAAGTYWLTFEPVAGSGFNRTMPIGAPNPLEKYAFFGNGNQGYLYLPPATGSLGLRIYGTQFPGLAFGTATRTMLNINPPFDITSGGDGQALDYHWIIDLNGGGWSFAVGRLIEGTENSDIKNLNGLSAGAYAVTCWSAYATCSTAGGRGVAYRTFLNSAAVARTFRIKALFVGSFNNSGGRATAGIYAFDPAGFSSAIVNSGVGSAAYLLRRDGLAEYSFADSSLSLASLFPGSVLASTFVTANFLPNQVQTLPLQTGFLTVNPGQHFTLMFDVMAYSSNGGAANFGDTLVPDVDLFTDASGNPVPELIAVGPSLLPSKAAASIQLGPSAASNPLGVTHSVTATVRDAGGAPVPNATVFFTIPSGPNAGKPGPAITDSNGQATFSYTSGLGGTDSIQANVKAIQSNNVQATWTIPGLFDHIAISPANANITASGSQAYTAQSFDKFGNNIGSVTSGTTFAIAPDGSCTGASCTASIPGPHTVTGTYSSKTAQASLMVDPSGGPVPTSKGACDDDGWKNLQRADGSSFKNQGDCIQYVNTGK